MTYFTSLPAQVPVQFVLISFAFCQHATMRDQELKRSNGDINRTLATKNPLLDKFAQSKIHF